MASWNTLACSAASSSGASQARAGTPGPDPRSRDPRPGPSGSVVRRACCERVVVGSEVLDPLARLRALLCRGQGELVALGGGGGRRFGRTERGEPLLRMPTA